MIRRPQIVTRTDTLFPDTTLCRSVKHLVDARPSKSDNIWTVVDLFSGCGGRSAGFARRQSFRMLGAVDLEYGKPCAGAGALDCNQAYSTNIGVDRKSTRLNSSH